MSQDVDDMELPFFMAQLQGWEAYARTSDMA